VSGANLAWLISHQFCGNMGGLAARAFSLLLRTGKSSEVRLFSRKSRVEIGCPVYTRSENAIATPAPGRPCIPASRPECAGRYGIPGLGYAGLQGLTNRSFGRAYRDQLIGSSIPAGVTSLLLLGSRVQSWCALRKGVRDDEKSGCRPFALWGSDAIARTIQPWSTRSAYANRDADRHQARPHRRL
jgi:hypothetical protein